MNSKELKIRITFTEELLGTAAATPDVHRKFIASKAPDATTIEEEVASIGIDEVVEKSMSVFPRDSNGKPIVWDYQIKGFFKDACGSLARLKDQAISGKIKAYKKIIDGLIFVEPRKIPIIFEGELGNCQRPLRAQTLQGERIALANSETIPSGATLDFTVILLDVSLESAIMEWLDYGRFRGLGQWRNSGKGKFRYAVLG